MKRLMVVIASVILMVSFSGCAPAEWAEEEASEIYTSPDDVEVFEKGAPDGGTVTCFAIYYQSSVSLSCDWEGYHLEQGEE